MAKDSADLINHCVGVRLRLTGSGLMRLSLHDLGIGSSVLPTITMVATSGKFGNVIANYKSQKMQVQFKTTAINEIFRIGTITVFSKPSATGYPQSSTGM